MIDLNVTNQTLSDNELFTLLSNVRRRRMLSLLYDCDGTAQLQKLAEQIAAEEHGKPCHELSDDEIKKVYISLYQTHVPKFENTGIIHFDSDTGVVKMANPDGRLIRYIENSVEYSAPLSRYYFAIGIGGLLLATATVLDIAFFDLVSGGTIGVILAAVILILTTVQHFSNRMRTT